MIIEGIYTEHEVTTLNKGRVEFFMEELEIELRGEIEATMGKVERMQFFPENPGKGVVKIKFETGLSADECIKVMSGRFFDGRQLHAFFWDGKTDYRIVRESNDELNRRIDDFGKWLEEEQPEQV